jgi:hypothetical protein
MCSAAKVSGCALTEHMPGSSAAAETGSAHTTAGRSPDGLSGPLMTGACGGGASGAGMRFCNGAKRRRGTPPSMPARVVLDQPDSNYWATTGYHISRYHLEDTGAIVDYLTRTMGKKLIRQRPRMPRFSWQIPCAASIAINVTFVSFSIRM